MWGEQEAEESTFGFLGTQESLGLPRWLNGKESTCNAGDVGLITGSGQFSGEGNDNPLQNSCLENPMDRGPWQAIDHEAAKSWTQLSDQTTTIEAVYLIQQNSRLCY